MQYMGSKRRIRNEILPLILKHRKNGDHLFVEPFAGGMNITEAVTGNRVANDSNEYLISLINEIVYNNWSPPLFVSKELYYLIKKNKADYPTYLVGYVGFCCSFGAKWFGGWVHLYGERFRRKNGTLPSYQEQARNGLLKQIPKLQNVTFTCMTYLDMDIPAGSIIYCDPPYKSTTKYKSTTPFNYDEFYEWCKLQQKNGCYVYISEYSMPNDFIPIWEKPIKVTVSNGDNSKENIEKLFMLKNI